jgi:predicted ester cyclase
MKLHRNSLTTAFLLALIPNQSQAQISNQSTGVSMPAAVDHAAVIHRFYEQCINQYHSEIIPELFTPNAVFHSSTGDGNGLDSVRKTVDNVHALFPNHHFTVDDVVVNGDKAAARWTMTALNTAPIAGVPPTGRPITNRAIVFYRFEGNKIAELWLQVDQIGVFRQIGVQLPGAPPANTSSQPARQ